MRFYLLPVVLACLLTVSKAEEPKRDLPLGLIDVGHIFKNYKPAAEKLATLKPALQELEKTLQVRQVEMEQIQRKIAQPKEGDDRAKLQGQLNKLQNELRIFVETERLGLQKRELQLQAEIYREVQAEVQKIAKERGLKLVVVRPRGSLDTEDTGELNHTLNQLVIFEDGLDITHDVLKALQAKAAEEK